MRVLVTGASGFVGRHLTAALRESGDEVAAPDVDVRDAGAVREVVMRASPQAVVHLAAQAFVPQAIADPDATYDTNVRGTANVLAAIRALKNQSRNVRLLFVSSADVYGAQPPEALPLRETALPQPRNPYAASKLAAEALIFGEVRSFGLDAMVTRGFNHIGPGQDERFAVASFAKQLALVAGGKERIVYVGDLTAKRDILDVRDVVQAYIALLRGGSSGEIYNVCSQTAVSMREILGELIRIAHVPVEVREDSSRMRPSDTPILYGSNEKLRTATQWQPRIPLRRSLQDVYADAQMRAA